ncbi:MAG TPA: hypothetical protein VEI26_07710 [Terriglobales bacterium]|nr:hypothetical protein [Terriglobales bacterium]
MSSIQDVSAEQFARLFQHYHEALVHDYKCTNNEETNSWWDRTPGNERKLLVAAVRLTLEELGATSSPAHPSRKYFAKPGEADWGC